MQLCATWQSPLRSLKTGDGALPDWGPTQEELIHASIEQVMPAGIDEEDEDVNDEYEADLDLDSGFLETLDALDMAAAYRDFLI